MKKNTYQKLSISNPAVDQVRETIKRTHLNGGIILECFKIQKEELRQFPARVDEIEVFLKNFLTSYDVQQSLPELKVGDQLACPLELQWVDPFSLDGEIASVLYSGGAYEAFPGSPREAKKMAQDLCNVIFADRFPDIKSYSSYKPWSPWFYDVAWEYSYFIIDTSLNRIWLICITDTD